MNFKKHFFCRSTSPIDAVFRVFQCIDYAVFQGFPPVFPCFFVFGKKRMGWNCSSNFCFNLVNFLCVFVHNFVNIAYINTKFLIANLLYRSPTVKSIEYTQETILEVNYMHFFAFVVHLTKRLSKPHSVFKEGPVQSRSPDMSGNSKNTSSPVGILLKRGSSDVRR